MAAPARELYTGQLFQVSRRWAEQNADAYFIASAKHLLIEPDTEIEPYEQKLTDLSAEDQRWRARQIESQFHRFWVDYCEFAKAANGFTVRPSGVRRERFVVTSSFETIWYSRGKILFGKASNRLLRVFSFAELFDRFPAECRQVVRIATCHQSLITNTLFVDPVRTGID